MLFRIYFLVLPKLLFTAFGAIFLLTLLTDFNVAWRVGMWIFLPAGLLGAGLAIYLLFIHSKLACPFCGTPSDVNLSEQPGVLCPKCGYMYVRGPWALSITREIDHESEDADSE
jgi:hypothetical protein